ncbi:MAG: hypothetical protein A4E23_01391 [Methanomethylovorans sp. PtaU1.Bin073]|nr:MAG: hypothetical protein A4E23_01391 [Methanomethylovorans sp. PtaU1.Bin073]
MGRSSPTVSFRRIVDSRTTGILPLSMRLSGTLIPSISLAAGWDIIDGCISLVPMFTSHPIACERTVRQYGILTASSSPVRLPSIASEAIFSGSICAFGQKEPEIFISSTVPV